MRFFCNLWLVIFANARYLKITKYDENEARRLLNLAAASYGDELLSCLNRTFKDVTKYKVVKIVNNPCDVIGTICNNYVVASEPHQHIYVIFRGSRTIIQVLLEGWDQIKYQPFLDMGMVHSYFFHAHNVLWPSLVEILNSTKYQNYGITFTGHSLGGALASLAAVRTVKEGYRSGNDIKVVTFGQPRVGNFEYAMIYDQLVPNSYRVVYRKDIVPHFPACLKNASKEAVDHNSRACDAEFNNRRYHHGTEIWYPNGMTNEPESPEAPYMECVGAPINEDFRCSDKLKFYYGKIKEYIWDHRHYFGIRVPEFGKSGCDVNYPEGLKKPNT
ncbi:unnamed protein product [Caenorhabditis bovis]|uniref:Fungal lipase-type domain-containing protein n=1 Tax=Caenorhabditis bovis TaxID=2654633 RepID=A0A8S1E9K7_9PELO|nr:unnamed protein product [Caenorhabditis bovis]